MFTAEQIQSLFGQPVIEYLQNKNRRGINGQKGSTYENSNRRTSTQSYEAAMFEIENNW
jgi:hypothetical protein